MFFKFAYSMLSPRLSVLNGISSAEDLQRKYEKRLLNRELKDHIRFCKNKWFE